MQNSTITCTAGKPYNTAIGRGSQVRKHTGNRVRQANWERTYISDVHAFKVCSCNMTNKSKDTIGEQVIISARSLTPLHQRMDWKMKRKVRRKDMEICIDPPMSMDEDAMYLQWQAGKTWVMFTREDHAVQGSMKLYTNPLVQHYNLHFLSLICPILL